MQIRLACPQDLGEIVAIYNAAIPHRQSTADLEPITVESRLEWFQEHSPQQYPIWVAEKEGQVVGWLSFQLFYGRQAYHKTAEVSLYIAPTHQGQGVGTLLLQTGIAHRPQLNISTLVGFIFAHNQPSLKLFNKMGFQRWGYLPQVAEMDELMRDLVIVGLQIARSLG